MAGLGTLRDIQFHRKSVVGNIFRLSQLRAVSQWSAFHTYTVALCNRWQVHPV